MLRLRMMGVEAAVPARSFAEAVGHGGGILFQAELRARQTDQQAFLVAQFPARANRQRILPGGEAQARGFASCFHRLFAP